MRRRTLTVTTDTANEIEIHFTHGDIDSKFEAKVDNGRLEISGVRDTQSAEPGTYDVGGAARMKFSRAAARPWPSDQ